MGSPCPTVSQRIYLKPWDLFSQNLPVSIAPNFLGKGCSNSLKSIHIFNLIDLSQDGLGQFLEAVAVVPERCHLLP